MKHVFVTIAIALLASCNPPVQSEENDRVEASLAPTTESDVIDIFDRILQLEGEWEGDFEWTGAMTGSGYLKARYTINGAKSAMIENLLDEDGNVTMSSVYHLDGKSNLRMTHYCFYNQPRLKASSIGSDFVKFDFLDITNLAPDAGHVNGVRLEFVDENKIHIFFDYIKGEDKSQEFAQLTRIN